MLSVFSGSNLSMILQENYMVSMSYFTDEIAKVLQDHYQGSEKPLLFLLHGLNTDSNKFAKPAELEVLKNDASFVFSLPAFLCCSD